MNTEDLPEILTTGQVAKLYNAAPKTVSQWAKDGRLPSFRTPAGNGVGHRRFHRDQILALRDGGRDHREEVEARAVLTLIRELLEAGKSILFQRPEPHGSRYPVTVFAEGYEPTTYTDAQYGDSPEAALLAAWAEVNR